MIFNFHWNKRIIDTAFPYILVSTREKKCYIFILLIKNFVIRNERIKIHLQRISIKDLENKPFRRN